MFTILGCFNVKAKYWEGVMVPTCLVFNLLDRECEFCINTPLKFIFSYYGLQKNTKGLYQSCGWGLKTFSLLKKNHGTSWDCSDLSSKNLQLIYFS